MTGCSKKANKKVYESNFKFSYNTKEIESQNYKSVKSSISNNTSNYKMNNYFDIKSGGRSKKNENSISQNYIGSNPDTMRVDKGINRTTAGMK